MNRFVWNPAWDTGVPSIDEQHHQLLTEFNDYFEAVHSGLHRRHTANLLEFLVDFLDMHFEEEEALMRVSHYSRFRLHTADHEAIRSRLQTLVNSASTDAPALEVEVVAFVMDWVEHHINVEDRKMARHFLRLVRKNTGAVRVPHHHIGVTVGTHAPSPMRES